jgi:hypothetical protein
LFKVDAVEALLAGIVGTLIAICACLERGHDLFFVIAFFVALIVFACYAAFEPASTISIPLPLG